MQIEFLTYRLLPPGILKNLGFRPLRASIRSVLIPFGLHSLNKDVTHGKVTHLLLKVGGKRLMRLTSRSVPSCHVKLKVLLELGAVAVQLMV